MTKGYLNDLFEIKLIFLQSKSYVAIFCVSVWDVFNNFHISDATDRSKIRSDQKCFLSH